MRQRPWFGIFAIYLALVSGVPKLYAEDDSDEPIEQTDAAPAAKPARAPKEKYLPVRSRVKTLRDPASDDAGKSDAELALGSPDDNNVLPVMPPPLPEDRSRRLGRRAGAGSFAAAFGVTQSIGLSSSSGSGGGFYPAHNSQNGGNSTGSLNSSNGNNLSGGYGVRGVTEGDATTTGSASVLRSGSGVSGDDLYPWLYDSGPTDTGGLGNPSSFGGPLNYGGGGGGGGGFGSATDMSLTARAGYLATNELGFFLSARSTIPDGQLFNGGDSGSGSSSGSGGGGRGAGGDQAAVLTGGTSYKFSDVVRVSAAYTHIFMINGFDPNNPGGYSGGSSGGLSGNGQLGGPSGYVPDTDIGTLSTDFHVTREINLNLNVPYGFQNGIQDPSASIRARYRLYGSRRDDLFLLTGIAATAPLSSLSQQEGKITTVSAIVAPTYHYYGFSVGLTGNVSYTFYNADSGSSGNYYSPNGPDNGPFGNGNGGGNGSNNFGFGGSYSNSPQIFRDSGNLTLGYRISREFRASTSGGLNYTYNEDGSYSWGTHATVASLQYTPGDLTLSASFSLASDPQDNQTVTLPTLPVVGLSIQYLFGERGALTGGAPGTIGRGGGGGGGGRRGGGGD